MGLFAGSARNPGAALAACFAWVMGPAVSPAEAGGLPPMDLARGEVAVQAALPALGADVSLGRLVLGASAAGAATPWGLGYGFVAHAGWRLSGLPRRETTVGLAVVGGAASLGGVFGGSGEAWFVQPALALAVPLGGATLRAAGGPVLFVTNFATGGAAGGRQGFLPFFPNLELAFPLGEGSELTIGGLPGLVGWRGTF